MVVFSGRERRCSSGEIYSPHVRQTYKIKFECNGQCKFLFLLYLTSMMILLISALNIYILKDVPFRGFVDNSINSEAVRSHQARIYDQLMVCHIPSNRNVVNAKPFLLLQ